MTLTPEASWLLIGVALSALYTAGWVGWKLHEVKVDLERAAVLEETHDGA